MSYNYMMLTGEGPDLVLGHLGPSCLCLFSSPLCSLLQCSHYYLLPTVFVVVLCCVGLGWVVLCCVEVVLRLCCGVVLCCVVLC